MHKNWLGFGKIGYELDIYGYIIYSRNMIMDLYSNGIIESLPLFLFF